MVFRYADANIWSALCIDVRYVLKWWVRAHAQQTIRMHEWICKLINNSFWILPSKTFYSNEMPFEPSLKISIKNVKRFIC